MASKKNKQQEPSSEPDETAPSKSDTHLLMSVRVWLAKPTNVDWSEAGAQLRSARDLTSRMMNAGVRGAAVAFFGGDKNVNGAARAAIDEQIDNRRAFYRSRSKKGKAEDRQRDARSAEFVLSGSIVDTARQASVQKFKADLKDILRGDKSLPTYRYGTPIPLRDGQWSLLSDDKGCRLRFKLTGGRTEWLEFVAVAGGDGAYTHLRRIASGDEQFILANARIRYDEHRKRWLATLCYWNPKPKADRDPTRVLCVRRGISSILTAASSDAWFGRWQEATYRVDDEGGRPTDNALMHKKRMIDARRRALQRHTRYVGCGARGRGEKRRMAHLDRLRTAEADFVDTFSKQAGAWVAARALERQCGTVAIEDFGSPVDPQSEAWWLLKRWPWAQLKAAIVWACKKAGLAIREVSAEANCRRCPAPGCGHELTEPEYKTFTCPVCGYKRPADYVAVVNMLAAATGNRDAQRSMDKIIAETREKLRAAAGSSVVDREEAAE